MNPCPSREKMSACCAHTINHLDVDFYLSELLTEKLIKYSYENGKGFYYPTKRHEWRSNNEK